MRKYSASIAIAAGLTLSATLIPQAIAQDAAPAPALTDPALTQLIQDTVEQQEQVEQLSPEEQEAEAARNATAADTTSPASPEAIAALRDAAAEAVQNPMNARATGSSSVDKAPEGYGPEASYVGPAEKRNYQVAAQFVDTSWRAQMAQYKKGLESGSFKGKNGESIDPNRVQEVTYYSPSMKKDIPFIILKASKPDRPVVYLLNGAGGGEQSVNWMVQKKRGTQTPIIHHYMEQDVNLVIPMRGAFSYYTDWVKPANGNSYLRGPQYWETFLTKELPQVLESTDLQQTNFDNTKRAIIGMSMSATSSLLLAQHSGDLYSSVGSFSGCAATSKPFPWAFMALTIDRGGESPENMWGKAGSDVNVWNDALIQSKKLAGKAVYVSNGSGLTSGRELASTIAGNANSASGIASSSEAIVTGGIIEAATNSCTHDLAAKLKSDGIPATFNFRPTGVHTWSYWIDDVTDSWPTIAKGLGIENELTAEDNDVNIGSSFSS